MTQPASLIDADASSAIKTATLALLVQEHPEAGRMLPEIDLQRLALAT